MAARLRVVGWLALGVLVLAVLPLAWAQPTTPTRCGDAPPTRLIVRERGRVLPDDPTPLNMRAGASRSFERVAQIPVGDVFYVLEGAQCSEGFRWYRVEYGDVEGWIAEGDAASYYVEPYPPGW